MANNEQDKRPRAPKKANTDTVSFRVVASLQQMCIRDSASAVSFFIGFMAVPPLSTNSYARRPGAYSPFSMLRFSRPASELHRRS